MRLPFLLPILLLCLGAAPATVPGAGLASLSGQLAHLRVTQGANQERDAGPELTPVKRALREWIERQLPAEPTGTNPDGGVDLLDAADLAPLALHMNQQLDRAGLTCGVSGSPTDRCITPADSSADMRGHVGEVRLTMLDGGRYVLVVTGVGVVCGYDESAYLYEQHADHHWHLVLASEQNDYTKGKYAPQNFISIAVSPSQVGWNEQAPPPLIATLGFSPWCSSNWQTLYTRMWRASAATTTPVALLDRGDSLFRGDYMVAAARLTDHDLLVQYTGGSIDSGVMIRAHVMHYRVGPADKLERIAPVALDPQAFVEEWLASDWSQAMRWNERPDDNATLARLRPTIKPDGILSGDFDDSLRRCRADPALWQVALTLDADGKTANPPLYFKVRWMPPYRFTLVEAGAQPFAGCDEEVTEPDDVGTLFPLQGWRADAS